eukprot:RCo006322
MTPQVSNVFVQPRDQFTAGLSECKNSNRTNSTRAFQVASSDRLSIVRTTPQGHGVCTPQDDDSSIATAEQVAKQQTATSRNRDLKQCFQPSQTVFFFPPNSSCTTWLQAAETKDWQVRLRPPPEVPPNVSQHRIASQKTKKPIKNIGTSCRAAKQSN